MILCDTNILIEFYKGNPKIVETLQNIGPSNLAVSAVTTGELYYGAKDKQELRKIQKHLLLLQQIPLDEEISAHFISLLGVYSLSHKLSIPDALIAATALSQELPLYTLNVKDFRFISKLQLYP
ncbi:MAG: type II toxin-antitoxin system VapC family toxin [Anaerolineales bacterium]